MFDIIRCKYPLLVVGANDLDYQTKDTPSQWMDQYEIQEDGALWHQTYDIEDHSEAAKWIASNPGKELPNNLDSLGGCLSAVNKRWEPENFTGQIRFYTFRHDNPDRGWIEWSAYFVDGKLNQLNLIEDREQ